MPAARHIPAQPSQVRADVRRGEEDRQPAPHQGRRQGPHGQDLPHRVHGSVVTAELLTFLLHGLFKDAYVT